MLQCRRLKRSGSASSGEGPLPAGLRVSPSRPPCPVAGPRARGCRLACLVAQSVVACVALLPALRGCLRHGAARADPVRGGPLARVPADIGPGLCSGARCRQRTGPRGHVSAPSLPALASAHRSCGSTPGTPPRIPNRQRCRRPPKRGGCRQCARGCGSLC